jgi:hypothetical protein
MNIRQPPLSQSTLTANAAVGHFAVALPSDLVQREHNTRALAHEVALACVMSIETHCGGSNCAGARDDTPDANASASSGIFNLKGFINSPERSAAAVGNVCLG